MPGSHIPILKPDDLIQAQPDYVLILPWNIADEVKRQLSGVTSNSHFVTAVPIMKIL
jgi:hypothetical protein